MWDLPRPGLEPMSPALAGGIFFFFFAVCGPLTVVASPIAEHRLRMRRLSGHGSRAQPLHGMLDPPGLGHEPVPPASAGGLSTTAPPGKPPSKRNLNHCQQTNLPIFKLKESTVRRRYSDFEWLRSELERESKVVVPPLPGKAFLRQLPFRGDDGIFDDNFIEERKQGLEQFINKVAGHPLAQNERCLHMFLQDEIIDKSYTPSKIRHA
ncbi:sorting nexin-3 isoform X2 [Phocoena sinus]|uniref:Sorting nexin 3 n=1 Tax=Phocoena sinus TaxID=42100 RepID=A0A8C9E4E2_PHOSS|nr:sorting nexin-3 isoform X2 [Phocoena sinus]